ncbi:MAG TPA: cation:proton antiporter [Solirubrobacteraceae bacterium]|jgi:NhaP-type Na+/H+ or K+/H+ antiporter
MRALIYLIAGILLSLLLRALGAGHLDPLRDHSLLREACDVALIVSVFASGLAVERRVARSSWRLIAVLLVVGIPATIAAVAWFASAAMGLGLGAAAVLGAMLAPTDPVLAGELGLGEPTEEVVGEPRLSLHTEAGANDGLAAPFLAGALLLARHGGAGWVGHWLAVDVAVHVAESVALGALAGLATIAVVRTLRDRGAFGPDRPDGVPRWRLVIDGLVLAVPFGIYMACEPLHGYGLVAVFAAGFAFRRGERDERLHAHVHWICEESGRLTELVAVVLVGLVVAGGGLSIPGLGGWLLAPVVIVVVRPLLVLALSAGTPLSLRERLYLGFFGVRGVAAVYYAAVIAGTRVLAPHETAVVVWTTLVCVAVSVALHGVTAGPLRRRWLGEE